MTCALLPQKYALQAVLTMEGAGFSSKIKILLTLAKDHFGKEITENLRKLFNLYIKSEYNLEFLNKRDVEDCIKCAEKIFDVYSWS